MVWEVHPSEKVHARSHRFNKHLVRVKFETKAKFKESTYLQESCFQLLFIIRKNHKVISIADIVFGSYLMLHKLVKLIHIDVYQKLRGEVAEW